MEQNKVQAPLVRKLKYPYKIFNDLRQLVKNPVALSYYPDRARKSRWTIIQDMLYWFATKREVNRFYYVYGLDLKGEKHSDEVLGLPLFRKLRDTNNQKIRGLNFNYVALLRDKFLFGQFLASLQFRTPRNIALINGEEITWLDSMQTVPIDQLEQITDMSIDGFCKKLTGIKGEGSFPLRLDAGRIYVGDVESSLNELKGKIDETYLFQERITQHPEMARLNPSSVNTIRLITFNNHGKVDVFCATQRIGAHNQPVDNWASGGIVVGIELETGRLREHGLFKPGKGGRVEVHPDTGVAFKGYKIPFFEESVQQAVQLHKYLYGIHSIGWDIAITDNGPIFIEGNDDWDGTIAMSLESDFKSRFLEMYKGGS
jgi:hypothetical protein